jgi:fibro-slime domain-containing protein
MSGVSTGRVLLGRALFWSLLAMAGCSSGGGKSGPSENGAGAGGDTRVGLDTTEGGEGGNAGADTRESSGGTASTHGVCGDSTMNSGEACDDGNGDDGDGCSADCRSIETDFACPTPGEDCVPVHVCGDKRITGTENCDDGNDNANDGCSAKCRTEVGYTCSIVGALCKATACGDGIVAGQEGCDDGQVPPLSGDGCSDTCALETPTPEEANAWLCPTAGAPCVRTTCGDGHREGSEQCDDGNNDTSDGCSPFCRTEPACPTGGGPCSTACGDGILLATDIDQQCDDGNTVSGDGCSSTCQVEAGYTCDSQAQSSSSLTLPIVFRDFKGTAGTGTAAEPTKNEHPDFEKYNNGFERNIVQPLLDSAGKPQHVTVNRNNTENTYADNVLTSTVDYFSKWYRDDPTYNQTVIQTLTFTQLATGEFRYADSNFFRLNGLGWGNYKTTGKNFHFTSEVRYWFEYQGGETLQFKGDDDLWVFVNRQLAVDLGGVHGAINGSVVLDDANGSGSVCENVALGDCTTPRQVDLGLVRGSVYEIAVFQAERHTTASNYTLTLGNFNAKRSVCTSRCGDGIVTPDEACDLGDAANTGAYGTCSSLCTLPAYCGDGTLDDAAGEACDNGINLSAYGYNGIPACNPSCQWTHYCGDKKVDSLFGEECDDGNDTSGDGCEPNCTHRQGCGDGKVDADSGEECDDGGTESGDGCSEFCTVEGDDVIIT